MFRILLFISATVVLNACSLSNTVDSLTKTQSANNLTYSFSDGGCSTGEHTFYSKEQLCDGLKNDALNNFCALSLRQSKFRTDCQGQDW